MGIPNNSSALSSNQANKKNNELKGAPKGLKILEVIGNGTFGVVYKAEYNG